MCCWVCVSFWKRLHNFWVLKQIIVSPLNSPHCADLEQQLNLYSGPTVFVKQVVWLRLVWLPSRWRKICHLDAFQRCHDKPPGELTPRHLSTFVFWDEKEFGHAWPAFDSVYIEEAIRKRLARIQTNARFLKGIGIVKSNCVKSNIITKDKLITCHDSSENSEFILTFRSKKSSESERAPIMKLLNNKLQNYDLVHFLCVLNIIFLRPPIREYNANKLFIVCPPVLTTFCF